MLKSVVVKAEVNFGTHLEERRATEVVEVGAEVNMAVIGILLMTEVDMTMEEEDHMKQEMNPGTKEPQKKTSSTTSSTGT